MLAGWRLTRAAQPLRTRHECLGCKVWGAPCQEAGTRVSRSGLLVGSHTLGQVPAHDTTSWQHLVEVWWACSSRWLHVWWGVELVPAVAWMGLPKPWLHDCWRGVGLSHPWQLCMCGWRSTLPAGPGQHLVKQWQVVWEKLAEHCCGAVLGSRGSRCQGMCVCGGVTDRAQLSVTCGMVNHAVAWVHPEVQVGTHSHGGWWGTRSSISSCGLV